MAPGKNSKKFSGEPREQESWGDKVAQAMIKTGEYLNKKISEYREHADEYQDSVEAKGSFYADDSVDEILDGRTYTVENETRKVGADD